MPLTNYQKRYLRNFRADEREKTITLWTLTKTVADTNDPYVIETITSGSRTFLGAIAWGRTIERSDGEGGYSQLSDITITCSSDEESYLKAENSYLVVDAIKLRLKRYVLCEDSAELVVFCERIR